jgi:predicted ATPase
VPSHRPLVGREIELQRLRDALGRGGLVVLVGPGGVGKTRLAEEAAGAVEPIALAGVRDEEGLVRAVGSALRLAEPDVERIGAALAAGPALVWFDGVDGLDDGALRALAGWAVPGGTLLATSRRHLGIGWHLPVEPLAPTDAVALFLARAAEAGFTPTDDERGDVERLVARLDHLPLALELAAGRVYALGPGGLAARLTDGLDALEVRERSLEASIAASWALLGPADRDALAGTTLLVGPFAASDLPWLGAPGAATDRLTRLVERSLLRVLRTRSGARYQGWEGVRTFAAARLAPALAQQVEDGLVDRGRAFGEALFGPGEAEALDGLQRLLPSLLAAAERARGDAPRLAKRVLALDPALQARGPAAVRRRWVAEALLGATGAVRAALLAKQVETEPALVPDEALVEALTAHGADPELASALRLARGRAAWNRAELPGAELRYVEALAHAPTARDRLRAAYALGGVRSARGDTAGALRTFEEALAEARDHGSALAEGLVLGGMGVVGHDVDHPDAETWLRRSVEALTASGDPRAAAYRLRLADRALARGDRSAALAEAEAAFSDLEAAGQLRLLGHAHGVRGLVREAMGDLAGARDDLVRGEALERRYGNRAVEGLLACWRARLEADAGERPVAEAALARARALLTGVEHPYAALVELSAAHLALPRGESAANALRAAESAGERSSEVRAARARLAAAAAGDLLELAADGAWFALGATRVDLSTRHPIRRVLVALATASGPSDVDALFQAGWPGERATVEAARDRVYHAVATLRRLGLGERLTRGEGGWQLRLRLTVARATG